LRSRFLGDSRVNSKEWKDAVFLVTRNEVRVQLNFDVTKEHARDREQPLIFSCAENYYHRKFITGNNRLKFLSAPDTKENVLSGILPLSLGMKVVLTVNICVPDGLANGAQGTLRQIVYDKDSVDLSSQRGKIIVLKCPPKYVVIELFDKSPGSYEGLPPNHVPIYPLKRGCVYTFWRHDGSKIQRNFQRWQLPLAPAFAFTDYKCQGQTLKKVIVDLANDNGNISTYVMLSRVQKLENLLILRPFKESVLETQLSPALEAEFKRLDECAEKTLQLKTWPEECNDKY